MDWFEILFVSAVIVALGIFFIALSRHNTEE